MAKRGMLSKEVFARHVRDALRDYYDAVRLEVNPLAGLLALLLAPGETKASGLRQILRETIETLQPPASMPYGSREWLGYRILWLTYVQSQGQQAVSSELALSRTSYYRHLAVALEAVTDILSDRYERLSAHATEPGAADRTPDARAVEHAIRLFDQSRPQEVDLADILEDLRLTLAPLEAKRRVMVTVSLPPVLPRLYCAPTVLRQVLLNALTEAMNLAAADTLELSVAVSDEATSWAIRGLDREKLVGRQIEDFPGFAVSQSLLNTCGARLCLEWSADGLPFLSFRVPLRRSETILIIDDDPDVVALYCRYLQTEPYVIRVAETAKRLREVLGQGLPDLVLLDVLMPREDGWNILQYLKTMPETADIPVVICSVLSQPHLAIALGATAVVQKPVPRPELLTAILKALQQANSLT